MPEGYPSIEALQAGGWLPVPRGQLPFRSIVAASRNDPLGRYVRVADLACDWGSELVDLGEVGHLNPASGFGEWPQAQSLIERGLQGVVAGLDGAVLIGLAWIAAAGAQTVVAAQVGVTLGELLLLRQIVECG